MVLDNQPSKADSTAAQYCRNIHFVAYSTLEPSGQRVEESVTWDAAQKAYIIKGPVLAYMLNDPGVDQIPSSSTIAQTTFRISIRQDPSDPVERFCEENFQESAQCSVHGDIVYTQTYTGCDLQTMQHVTKLTPDNAGSLQLLDVSFSDVQGNFGNPLYLSAGSDLRLRIRG